MASSLTGLLIDRWSPGPAVLVVGTVGIAAALFSWALARASPPRPFPPPPRPLSALSSRPAADSAAMKASPACALRENALRKTVQRPNVPADGRSAVAAPSTSPGRTTA